jgi:NAD(P)-dependent dehydrogenase (short-subunit alcohol dehydrogenase family)
MGQVTFDFSGKVALVTGSTSGIGRATALAFGRAGASVVVTGRRENKGAETVALIEAAGGKAFFQCADVTRPAEMEALAAVALERFGALHYAINNAGEGAYVMLENLSAESWELEIARNLGSTFHGMKHQIPAIRMSGGGAIVNVASAAAVIGLVGMSAYCAAKAGVVAISRAAASEAVGDNIRVNSLLVGAIMTDAWSGSTPEELAALSADSPMRRFGTVDEVANAALWLCSDGASFVTGHCLAVEGGYTSLQNQQYRRLDD